MNRFAGPVVRRCVVGSLVALFALSATTGCVDRDPIKRTKFRVNGDRFEIDRGKGWEKFFPRGVNLSVGKPGTFPGELAATYDDYRRYFKDIQSMNADTVRIYTLHHPRFYKAFFDHNLENESSPLYLVQGIWLDELEHGDYMSESTPQIDEEIRYVVDAVHGNAVIKSRFGKAYGIFDTDVSPWLMAWLPGHEMDGTIVEKSHEKHAGFTEYNGRYVSKKNGLPIEAWVARGIDHTVTAEKDRYGHEHPVAWSNWPALDPIHHPTETPQFGQDRVNANLAKFELKGFSAGVYASYHVYPFNPEFIIYDPEYVKAKDRYGNTNSYLGYMQDLVKSHAGVPVFVTEYGVPSSFGVAHKNVNGWHHGGYTEAQQADANVKVYHALVDSGAAGAIIFEWMDEWFKRTWMTNPTMQPQSRGRLWFDVVSPEESFGIVSYYPVPGQSVRIDGDAADWSSKAFVAAQSPSSPIRKVRVSHDPAFLFIHIETSGLGDLLSSKQVVMIGLDTVDGTTGDRKWPRNAKSGGSPMLNAADRGMESVVVLDPAVGELRMLTQKSYDPTPKLNGLAKVGGRPKSATDGEFAIAKWIINNSAQYIAAGGLITPPTLYYEPGKLVQGDSKTLTTAHINSTTNSLELRIPWHALWVTDPSSRQVLFDTDESWNFEHRTTEGIAVMVGVFDKKGDDLQLIARAPAGTGGFGTEAKRYTWKTWDTLGSEGERKKPLFEALQKAFEDRLPEKKL